MGFLNFGIVGISRKSSVKYINLVILEQGSFVLIILLIKSLQILFHANFRKIADPFWEKI